ncbi:MAG: phospholipase D-like domain-containing protein [Polyangiales bacterium]
MWEQPSWLAALWPWVGTALGLVVTVVAAAHVLLYKRDVRGAIGWVGIIVLAPLLGALCYLLFGINRIRRRVRAHREDRPTHIDEAPHAVSRAQRRSLWPRADSTGLSSLARVVDQVTPRCLLLGNALTLLENGDEAYPVMLRAIEEAQHSVALLTYIFDADPWGERFVTALNQAAVRGVEVRVLIDDAGARYSRPPADRGLGDHTCLRAARFLPIWGMRRSPYLNLRNHRKMLIVDGCSGFTGGLNIRAACVMAMQAPYPVRDVHFAVQGPVVRHLMEVFAEDWDFAVHERLVGQRWFPALQPAGHMLARGIADGPDRDFDVLRWTLLGAIACARERIRIVTPYFLPDADLLAALNVAAMRGVEVDIVVPARGNLAVVRWAMQAHLPLLHGRGCRIWLSPAPFDHSKVMVVDRAWTLIGSGNWDDRSLRLNFEFCVECYCPTFGAQMDAWAKARIDAAQAMPAPPVRPQLSPTHLRNSAARLLMPFL